MQALLAKSCSRPIVSAVDCLADMGEEYPRNCILPRSDLNPPISCPRMRVPAMCAMRVDRVHRPDAIKVLIAEVPALLAEVVRRTVDEQSDMRVVATGRIAARVP